MPQPYTENQTLLALPNSLQRSLQRVDNLLAQGEDAQLYGDYELATARAREAMQIIGQVYPELGTLLVGGQMGHTGFEMEIIERVDSYRLVPRTFLGLDLGTELVNTPTITHRTIRGRFTTDESLTNRGRRSSRGYF